VSTSLLSIDQQIEEARRNLDRVRAQSQPSSRFQVGDSVINVNTARRGTVTEVRDSEYFSVDFGDGNITQGVSVLRAAPVASEPATALTTMLDHALDAVRRGFYVFPCLPGRKDPATEHGLLDATNDVEQIKKWWAENPNYNPAVNCGMSHKVVRDYDSIAPLLPTDSATFVVRSGRINPPGREGGYHCYYEGLTRTRGIMVEPVLPIRDGEKVDKKGNVHKVQYDALDRLVVKGKAAAGEIRSRCAYVVWNGALHPSGNHYQITNDVPFLPWNEPDDVDNELSGIVPVGTEKQESVATRVEDAFNLPNVNIDYKPRAAYQGGFRWLIDCPFDYNHESRTISVREGGSSAAVIMLSNGALTFKCQHAHCMDQKWADLREWMEQQVGHKIRFGESEPVVIGGGQTSQTPTLAPDAFKYPAIKGTHRDYVIGPLFGQSDGWFPQGSVNTLGASSGGGKTTWMYDLLLHQRVKEDFEGHKTYGLSFLVLGVDRGEDAHKRTMERMRYNPDDIPTRFMPATVVGNDALHAIKNCIEECGPDAIPQIVFIEGADALVEKTNEGRFVAPFVAGLQRIAEHYHIAVILSLGAPKMKVDEGYTAKRDCLIGSEKWGRMSETVVVFQYVNGDDTNSRRACFVLPRNAPAEKFQLIFQGGRLVKDNYKPEESRPTPLDVKWFKDQAAAAKSDDLKKWWTAMDMELGMGCSRATAARRIQNALTKRYIIIKPGPKAKGGASQYCWNESADNPLWQEGPPAEQEDFELTAPF
jgi:hypothetical protein